MWLLYALLSAVSAAAVNIFAKLGLSGVDSVLATTIRSLIMAFFLVVVSLLFNKFDNFSFSLFDSRGWIFIILSAIAGSLSWLFSFFALKHGLASKVAVVDRLSFVLVVLFAALFLGEVLNWRSLLGLMLILGGVFIFLFN
jgi:transporter family protein